MRSNALTDAIVHLDHPEQAAGEEDGIGIISSEERGQHGLKVSCAAREILGYINGSRPFEPSPA